jgi:hypothetical protein
MDDFELPPATGDFPKYTKDHVKSMILVLRSGGTRCAAYEYAGISKACFYRWMQEIPGFEDLIIASENKARVFVESKLWERIKAGSGPDIRFWLETQGKEDWKRTGVSVSQGVTVHAPKEGATERRVTVVSRVSGLSDKDLEDIMRGIPKEGDNE